MNCIIDKSFKKVEISCENYFHSIQEHPKVNKTERLVAKCSKIVKNISLTVYTLHNLHYAGKVDSFFSMAVSMFRV